MKPPASQMRQDLCPTFEAAEFAQAKFSPVMNPDNTNLFDDFSMTCEQWTLRGRVPARHHSSSTAVIGTTWFQIGDPDSDETFENPDHNDLFNFVGWWPSWRYEMDESKAPNEITIYQVDPGKANFTAVPRERPGTRRLGVYDLTSTRLRIQMAQSG